MRRPRPAPSRHRRSGVTLLELLVSLSMMAALALILGTTLDLTARGAARLGSEADGLDLLLDRAALRRWIEEMPPGALFAGTPDRLAFETLIDEPPFWAGDLARVTLGRRDGPEGPIWAVAATPAGDIGREILLSEKSTGFALAYWGSQPPGAPRRWHAEWMPGSGLPDLLRISYDLEGRVLPPLGMRPARSAHHSTMSLSSLLPPG